MMQWHRKVSKLQFDVTSHCNARCGACVRNQQGGETEPELALKHFDMDLWKRLCTKDTKGWYIGQLALNGNWGDPMMHPDLVEMVKIWVDNHPETFIDIHTNGSMRNEKFWADLAKELRQYHSHQVNFAVDGLKDTHHLYRRKTDFDKIIENIKIFNEAGGSSRIITTVFEHNKHQITELRHLAETLKCEAYVIRRSHADEMKIEDKDESYTIKSSKDIKENEYKFESFYSKASDMINASQWIRVQDLWNDSKYLNDTKCPWYKDGEVQIDPFGTVWPCCHVSLFGINLSKHTLSQNVDDSIIERRTENSLFKYTLQEILSDSWFNQYLDKVVKKGKWEVCRRTCGVCSK